MELQRGVCNLCLENNKVLTPSDAEEFSTCLPRLLHENFLTKKEFQSIKDSIKICIICCFKVQTANEIKKAMQGVEENSETSNKRICRFCNDDSNLVMVRADWKYFNERTEGYLKPKDFPVFICPRCYFYFDAIFTIKSKLQFKFPHLLRKNTPKQVDTPKRKSMSKSPPTSKKRKIFDNCFAYLQPLCNNKYQVADKLKKDKRLYRKIAYVNLVNSKDVDVKETPKMRPIIKIKLKKPKGKKDEYRAQPYVKLSQSEEIPIKASSQKKARRHSFYEQKESYETEENDKPEENIDETPKAASVANLVPKRRVSVYLAEAEAGSEDKPSTPEENSSEAIKTVDKYIAELTLNDEDKSEQQDEVQDNVETNGIMDKATSESGEEDTELDSEQIEGVNNGKLPEDPPQTDNQVNTDNEDSNSGSSHSTNSSKSSINGSDSETNDKLQGENNTDRDSLNGSERKKKRVTFSDEIN